MLKKIFSSLFKNYRKNKLKGKDEEFAKLLSEIIGCNIRNLALYHEAFSLKNSIKSPEIKNFERLEFLGDAILGSIISCYLYQNYPDENEGFLTQMKSKIVNRKNLNALGSKLNLTQFIQTNTNGTLSENISGNLFEAFIGAIYLDLNYEICKNIILRQFFNEQDILKLENKIVSYKGLLLEWSQKKKVIIRYETSEETLPNKTLFFRCNVLLNNTKISSATETSKKKAEEKAAQRAFYNLNKKENILEQKKNIS